MQQLKKFSGEDLFHQWQKAMIDKMCALKSSSTWFLSHLANQFWVLMVIANKSMAKIIGTFSYCQNDINSTSLFHCSYSPLDSNLA